MSIAWKKQLNAHLPDSIKAVFGPVIRKQLICNPVFLTQFKELKQMETMSSGDIKRKQLTMLKDTLTHAYEHTVYYKKLFNDCGFNPYCFIETEQMRRIPKLTKQMIIDHFDELQSDDIEDYYPATTGGSTGVPLKVHLDRDSIFKERAFIYHFWSKYGYDYRCSKLAGFRGTDFHGKNFRANPLYNEVQVNPCNISAATIGAYCRYIEKFGAEFLHGFPSAIYSFCKFANDAGIDLQHKFKGVFFTGENVYDFQRTLIEETLGVPTAAFYGHSERAVFAEQGEHGYTFHDLYGYCEISSAPDSGIICTGFLNRKMPMIRYAVDDSAQPVADQYKITGHRDGFLSGANGEVISAAALEVHSQILDKVSGYQFCQRKKGEVDLYYMPFEPFSKADSSALQALFQTKTGDAIKVYVKEVTQMRLTDRGKFRLIMQESEAK